MGNLNSTDITVFPTTNRTAEYQRSARHLSEQNIVNITNKLTDYDSYVITQSFGANTIVLQFVVGGYYFNISPISGTVLQALTAAANIDSSSTDVYGTITLDSASEYSVLNGQDEIPDGGTVSVYTGISFSTSNPGESRESVVHLLTKNSSGSWEIPQQSMAKFNSNSLFSVDGGII